MIRSCSLFFAAFSLLAILALKTSIASCQSREVIPANQDAYVNQKNAKKNFGSEGELIIKKSKTGKQDRHCYLEFELPKKKQPIQLAMLDCQITSTNDSKIIVKACKENWRESRLNWDNAPPSVLDVAEVPALAGGRLLVDVTKTVRQARKAKLKSLTFLIGAKDVSQSTLRIASKEYSIPEERPQLLIDFKTTDNPIETSITYTETEKGIFAGLKLEETSGTERLGKFGGWKGWKLKRSGFFHTEKIDDLWTLVDPRGLAFFGFGLNSVREVDSLRLPKDIQAIGFNHLASWSDETIKNIPYTPRWNFIVEFKNTTPELKRLYLENDLMPVFEPTFAPFIDKLASKAAKRRNDPWLLGHFPDNEIPFHKTIQLSESLKLPTGNAQHQAAKAWLKKKHGKAVARSKITEEDELEYMGFVADRYFKVVTTALRKYDPNHLILGERLHASAKFNPHVIAATGKYCDVLSINFYRRWEAPREVLAMWRDVGKKPFIITEFYSKGADTGLPNSEGAGWVVPSQKERVQHFENFALQMLGTSNCVGIHWFRFVDDEGSNKGVYNLQYKPYQELQNSMKNLSRVMYRLRSELLLGNPDFDGQAKP